MILDPKKDAIESFATSGGGKAKNLAKLIHSGVETPPFFCVPDEALQLFIEHNAFSSRLSAEQLETKELADFEKRIDALFTSHPLPVSLSIAIESKIQSLGWADAWVAVRSSGLEEDGTEHSFAGQFSSFLFQKGKPAIEASIKRCWASAYSARALGYRKEKGLTRTRIRMGVIIQRMIDCQSAGVAFSRNPIRPLDRDHALVSSVWGLGEGLVSGELDADHFEVHRETAAISTSHIIEKTHALRMAEAGGLQKLAVDSTLVKTPSLTEAQARAVAALAVKLEQELGLPQDCEWGFESGKLYCLQTRPITNLPPEVFFDPKINGNGAILWDNSNIIESYNGVTSPLTFSFASAAYRQVYIQFCEVMGVPRDVIQAREAMFRNMLGLIRGRIYYHLVNWYRLVLMLPGASNNKQFMETMMGVKQQLRPEIMTIFDVLKEPMHYPLHKRMKLLFQTVSRWWNIDSIITDFQSHFDRIYQEARRTDFKAIPFPEHLLLYQRYDEELLRRWHAPIINDYLCMVFFGLLKKLTEKWLGKDAGSLQNDLLCGQGDLESTEPTKMLMRIAAWMDTDPAAADLKTWWMSRMTPEILQEILPLTPPNGVRFPEATRRVREFLDRFGFRCINELKLEASDLHDDPSFVIEAISAYVRRKSYSIAAMEEREKTIREKAEAEVRRRLSGSRLWIYNWVLKEARKAVRNRENLRFDRTKIFGVIRHLFRGMGHRLSLMGVIEQERDVFYLMADELLSFGEGRTLTLDLKALIAIRKREFAEFEATPPPPDRFLTMGTTAYSSRFPQVLMDGDLLRSERPVSDDPNLLYGTPCCPGVIEGVVRVVKEVADAQGLDGEILVTERTDPGWVPLYPSCSGLLIERGSLLSHSAVVARELGLPTIVGVSGGLVKKLKTGMRVRVDAGKGEVRILT